MTLRKLKDLQETFFKVLILFFYFITNEFAEDVQSTYGTFKPKFSHLPVAFWSATTVNSSSLAIRISRFCVRIRMKARSSDGSMLRTEFLTSAQKGVMERDKSIVCDLSKVVFSTIPGKFQLSLCSFLRIICNIWTSFSRRKTTALQKKIKYLSPSWFSTNVPSIPFVCWILVKVASASSFLETN